MQERHAESSEQVFEAVKNHFAKKPRVTTSRMFGSVGLKVNGKVFAMLVKGNLVVKLPKNQVEEIVVTKRGTYFDSGHGRLMREWASLKLGTSGEWIRASEEAYGFVSNKA